MLNKNFTFVIIFIMIILASSIAVLSKPKLHKTFQVEIINMIFKVKKLK